MPNNSYLRSRRREQELVREYREKGWYACRTAGSKSKWDVIVFNPEGRVLYRYQIKTTKGGRNVYDKILKIYQDVQITDIWREYK